MYKIQKGEVPEYLSNLIPPEVNEITNYNLRNRNDIRRPFARLNIFKNSFIPSTCQAWNDLPSEIKNLDTSSKFKRRLNQDLPEKPSTYFTYGKRKLNIIHAQLRNGCSRLNFDLNKVNLSSHMKCSCGFHKEDSTHYFIHCKLYTSLRNELKQCFDRSGISFDINNILYGKHIPSDKNYQIAKHVHQFIAKSKRFENYLS